MAFNDETYHQIQQYLDGLMTQAEREAFELEMAANPELAEEVQLNRDMQEFLADTPENALRKNLQTLSEQAAKQEKNRPARLWWWLLLVSVLALLLWWLIPGKPVTNSAPSPMHDGQNRTNEQNLSPVDTTKATPHPKKPGPKQEERADDAPASPPNSKKKQPKLFAANFQPMPALELLIGNNLRAGDFQWTDTQPMPDVPLDKPGSPIRFHFSGVLRTDDADMRDKKLNLYIFSNDPAAFETFHPVSSLPLRPEAAGDNTYRISADKSFAPSPGLYYYLIEDAATERIYLVNKFVVR
ncbi:MAG: hypothetical protein IPM36_20360 [Lewinellaceae bacterium]|nr:hypothetical protein [Lewinellaceae bacterium]